MAIVTTDNQHYTDIAAAIRSKNGTETLYKPSEMAAAIQAISGGGEPEPPDDGKTRLYITVPANAMPDRPPPRNQVPLYIQQTVANGVTIDWGDGTAPETLSGTGAVNTTHTYEQAGDYVISLEPVSGILRLGDGTSNACVMGTTSQAYYLNMLNKICFGKNSKASSNSCYYCKSLNSVFYYNDDIIDISSFGYCYSLRNIKIQEGATGINNNAFAYCQSLTGIIFPSTFKTIGGSAFVGCSGIKDIYIYSASPPTIQTSTFRGVPSDCIYHVRPESLEAYKAATNWTTITDQIVGDLEV